MAYVGWRRLFIIFSRIAGGGGAGGGGWRLSCTAARRRLAAQLHLAVNGGGWRQSAAFCRLSIFIGGPAYQLAYRKYNQYQWRYQRHRRGVQRRILAISRRPAAAEMA